MAKKRVKTIAHTEAIFRAALAEGISATQARTLAECLFWSQHSRHEIDGQRALYKTGAELSEKLGPTARTMNKHLKQLAEEGFWCIKYRPRPRHPSPVSWLLIAERSEVLLANAKADREGRARYRTLDRAERRQPEVRTCNAQTLHYDTSYRETSIQDNREDDSFVSDKQTGMNELSLIEDTRIKAPRYVGATKELEEFVSAISSALAVQELPPWDTVSQYTWEHARELITKLQAEGADSLSDQIELVSQIIAEWSRLRHQMDERYCNHYGNDYRPTPLALNHQFKKLFSALKDNLVSNNCSQEAGVSNLDGDFG
ncbi:MAG: hypothetical protein ABJN65_17245 [Parasphingorhabdus sp.]